MKLRRAEREKTEREKWDKLEQEKREADERRWRKFDSANTCAGGIFAAASTAVGAFALDATALAAEAVATALDSGSAVSSQARWEDPAVAEDRSLEYSDVRVSREDGDVDARSIEHYAEVTSNVTPEEVPIGDSDSEHD